LVWAQGRCGPQTAPVAHWTLTAAAARVAPPKVRPLQVRLPPVSLAPAEARSAAAAWLHEGGIPDTAVPAVVIAVSELVTDALIRDPADEIVVRAQSAEQAVEIEVESLPLEPHARTEGVLSMDVVSAVATRVSIRKELDGRHYFACSVMLDG
jgi:hypothetical protein